MELTWMGKYRTFVEMLIKYGNSYAQSYNTEGDYGISAVFSPSQLQVLEYILENEEKNQNMAEIAARLGIMPSAFSKNVKKMTQKSECFRDSPSALYPSKYACLSSGQSTQGYGTGFESIRGRDYI